ncbi:MAG: hypothetical protein JWQ07_5267 [Ramlibacter sp.]|nr:hypothetical protein [Ramlibacter sp.]
MAHVLIVVQLAWRRRPGATIPTNEFTSAESCGTAAADRLCKGPQHRGDVPTPLHKELK